MYKLFLGCLSVLLFFVSSCQTPKGSNQVSKSSIPNDTKTYFLNMRGDTIRKLALSDETWKSKLSEMEYKVLRQKGTERAFTGDLLDNKVEGLYTCRGFLFSVFCRLCSSCMPVWPRLCGPALSACHAGTQSRRCAAMRQRP